MGLSEHGVINPKFSHSIVKLLINHQKLGSPFSDKPIYIYTHYIYHSYYEFHNYILVMFFLMISIGCSTIPQMVRIGAACDSQGPK